MEEIPCGILKKKMGDFELDSEVVRKLVKISEDCEYLFLPTEEMKHFILDITELLKLGFRGL